MRIEPAFGLKVSAVLELRVASCRKASQTCQTLPLVSLVCAGRRTLAEFSRACLTIARRSLRTITALMERTSCGACTFGALRTVATLVERTCCSACTFSALAVRTVTTLVERTCRSACTFSALALRTVAALVERTSTAIAFGACTLRTITTLLERAVATLLEGTITTGLERAFTGLACTLRVAIPGRTFAAMFRTRCVAVVRTAVRTLSAIAIPVATERLALERFAGALRRLG